MIKVNTQSSIKIEDNIIIYFDPLKIDETHDADYILITHTHWDHFSIDDILKIKKDKTIIIGPNDIVEETSKYFDSNKIITILPNTSLDLHSFTIKTVPAYNLDKKYHPKENKWLGYLLTLNNTTYYIPGDTDVLKENESIKCDIAFIPIGGTYTMTAKEAAEFINTIKPNNVIPIHYNSVVGSKKDEKVFIDNLDNIDYEIYI